jgi:predicted dehydrogenase
VVTLATPIGLHYEQGRKAIERGIHVHFNKTMTTTVAEADDLIALARKGGVKLVASPGQMLVPANRAVRRLVQDGALGKLTWAATGGGGGVLRYHLNEGPRQGDDVLSNVDPTWYFKPPGGGPLYDRVVYEAHTLTGILGPARRVTAFSGISLPEREYRGRKISVQMDDNTLMLLDFGDALFAFVHGAIAGGVPTWIFGTEGVVRFEKGGPTLNGEPIEYPGRSEGAVHRPHVTEMHRGVTSPHIFEDIMQLVDWIREDRPTIVTAEHARHVIDIFESAYRSARTGKAQDLRTSFTPIDAS